MPRTTLKIPGDRKPVDWLIEGLGQAEAPLARWDLRHSDPFVSKLAISFADWPGVFDCVANQIVPYANYWCEEVSEPIIGMRNVDRRASFVGCFPWTCPKYPWPRVASDQQTAETRAYMSPLLQLNFGELDVGPLGSFPPVLLQVWGITSSDYYGVDQQIHTFDRVIPLADIASSDPDWNYKPWSNEVLGYCCEDFPDEAAGTAPTDLEWYDGKQTGERIGPNGDWNFSLGQFVGEKVEGWIETPDWLNDAEAGPLAELKEAASDLEEFGLSSPQLACGNGFFGGQMDAYYCSDEKYYNVEGRTVYAPRNAYDEACDGIGLRTFYRGTLGVVRSFDGSDFFSRIEW